MLREQDSDEFTLKCPNCGKVLIETNMMFKAYYCTGCAKTYCWDEVEVTVEEASE